MKLFKVYRGQAFEADVEFYNSDGSTPFVLSSPATYEVYDYQNNFILNGNGTQDTGNTARWYSSIVIPSSALISDNLQKYKIIWNAVGTNETKSSIEYFEVTDVRDPISIENGRLLLKNGKFLDYIYLDSEVNSGTVKLIDVNDNILYTDTISGNANKIINNKYVYENESTDLIDGLETSSGLNIFFSVWELTLDNTEVIFEIHPIYIISTRMFMYIDGVRRIIDKIRNDDINPTLKYTDIDLCHYVIDGIQRINRHKPNITNFHVDNIPIVFDEFVKKAGAIEALRAQYLAEGMAAFDFSGQSVTLTVDRTQYIQYVIDQLEAQLDDPLRATKKIYIRKNNAGTIGISLSPVLNVPSLANPREYLFYLRSKYINI